MLLSVFGYVLLHYVIAKTMFYILRNRNQQNTYAYRQLGIHMETSACRRDCSEMLMSCPRGLRYNRCFGFHHSYLSYADESFRIFDSAYLLLLHLFMRKNQFAVLMSLVQPAFQYLRHAVL